MSIPTTEQINAYAHLPERIVAAIADLDETQLQFVPAIGEWSIHEVVIHLADAEAVGYWRIRRALAEQRSELPVYNEEVWASKLSYRIQDRTLALQLFTALRASTAALSAFASRRCLATYRHSRRARRVERARSFQYVCRTR